MKLFGLSQYTRDESLESRFYRGFAITCLFTFWLTLFAILGGAVIITERKLPNFK